MLHAFLIRRKQELYRLVNCYNTSYKQMTDYNDTAFQINVFLAFKTDLYGFE